MKRKASSTIDACVGGNEYSLTPLWLRLNDPSRFTANKQRLFEIADVVDTAASTEVVKSRASEENLLVDWADGTQSTFSADWLKRHAQPRRPAEPLYLWSAALARFLPEVQYDAEDMPLHVSSHLTRYGIAIVHGVPTELGMVEKFGNEVGYVRTTNYGAIFDVIDLGTRGNNLAQTNCAIRAHTDNPYRDPFPGVQLLHCLANATEGGRTSFTDGFAAAAALRRQVRPTRPALTPRSQPGP